MEIEDLVKCLSCGEIFPSDEIREREVHGCYESDYGVYDQFSSHNYYSGTEKYCHHCGSSEEIERGYRCNECEEYVSWLADDYYGICDNCYSKYTDEEYNVKYPPKN